MAVTFNPYVLVKWSEDKSVSVIRAHNVPNKEMLWDSGIEGDLEWAALDSKPAQGQWVLHKGRVLHCSCEYER